MKRFFSILGVFLLLFMTGCRTEGADNESQQGGSAKKTTLTVASSFAGEDSQTETYRLLIRNYEGSAGHTVENNSLAPTEEWQSQIRGSFRSGSEPDVLYFYTGSEAEEFVKLQKVVPLEVIREEYPDYGKTVSQAAYEQTRSPSDNKNYAVPVVGDWEGMYVNKELFETEKLSFPQTWNQLLTVCQTFKDKGITPVSLSLSEDPLYWAEHLVFNYTGYEKHTVLPEALEDLAPSYEKGINDFKILYDKGFLPENTASLSKKQAIALFNEKKAAMFMGGHQDIKDITDKDNVEVIPFPVKEGEARENGHMIGGFSMGFYITKKAWDDPDKRKAAADFVTAMSSQSALAMFSKGGAATPASSSESVTGSYLEKSATAVTLTAKKWTHSVRNGIKETTRNQYVKDLANAVTGKNDMTVPKAVENLVKGNK